MLQINCLWKLVSRNFMKTRRKQILDRVIIQEKNYLNNKSKNINNNNKINKNPNMKKLSSKEIPRKPIYIETYI